MILKTVLVVSTALIVVICWLEEACSGRTLFGDGSYTIELFEECQKDIVREFCVEARIIASFISSLNHHDITKRNKQGVSDTSKLLLT